MTCPCQPSSRAHAADASYFVGTDTSGTLPTHPHVPTPNAAESRTCLSGPPRAGLRSRARELFLSSPVRAGRYLNVRQRKASLAHERAVSSTRLLVHYTLGIVLLVRPDLMAPLMRVPLSFSSAPTRSVPSVHWLSGGITSSPPFIRNFVRRCHTKIFGNSMTCLMIMENLLEMAIFVWSRIL